MASLYVSSRTGNARIDFRSPVNGKRVRLYLRKMAPWQREELKHHIEELVASCGGSVSMSSGTAEWLRTVSGYVRGKIESAGLIRSETNGSVEIIETVSVSERRTTPKQGRSSVDIPAILLKPSDAAKALAMSRGTLEKNLAPNGMCIPFFRTKGRLFFCVDSLMNWAQAMSEKEASRG